ncbi:MAG: GIY-YIG nuclease family protein, partial [Planctomycetota bacterium]
MGLSSSLEDAMNHGKQIRLFLTDGSAGGIRYAELMNWTGQAFSCPKALFAKLKDWSETRRPGVYVLVGLNGDGKDAVYIGESENVLKRLLWHLRKSTLDDIVEAFFFTSKDDNLTKGHTTHLEQRLVKRAEEAKQYVVEYGREPSKKTLSKPETETMEEFLDHLYLVSAALGFTVFEISAPGQD